MPNACCANGDALYSFAKPTLRASESHTTSTSFPKPLITPRRLSLTLLVLLADGLLQQIATTLCSHAAFLDGGREFHGSVDEALPAPQRGARSRA